MALLEIRGLHLAMRSFEGEAHVLNGIDLAVIINAWSTDGGKFPRADIDGNGFVDGADLAIVLGSWGPCS
jgi:hypothetical protein